MNHDLPHPHQAELNTPIAFERIETMLRDYAGEYGLTLHGELGRTVWIETGAGAVGSRPADKGSLVYARADSRDWLFTLQEFVSDQMAQLDPQESFVWNTPVQAGALPPNFSVGKVVSVRRLSPDFLRMRISGEGLERLARDMIHFRLVLPQNNGQPPRWPHLSSSGRSVWPEGLHRPAYTVSAIDAKAGGLETDIFIHDGGRVCGFAQAVAPGTVIGLNGPGGGGIPTGAQLFIAGDETAYPALRRIIAAQSPKTRITAVMLGENDNYPMPDHPGLDLTHCPRDEIGLAARLIDAEPADFYWIATEKARLRPLKRAVLDELKIPKANAHLAAYWSAPMSKETP